MIPNTPAYSGFPPVWLNVTARGPPSHGLSEHIMPGCGHKWHISHSIQYLSGHPMRPLHSTLSALMLAASSCAASDPAQPPTTNPPGNPPANNTPVLTRTVVMQGLSEPWDMAFASDGSMFFTEKCRGLSVRRPDGTVTRLFGTSGSVLVAPDLACVGQSGVHGIALDPQFATNRTLYVFMLSTLSTSPRTNRVVRLVANAGFTSVSNRTDIITDIAFKDQSNAVGGSGSHSGGRLRFGPDGFLYVTTGDNHNPVVPQSPTLLGGKVLRVTGGGAAAPGNASPSGFDPRIFTYGHRNVQGLTFRPGTGQPFVAEHGPNHSDEVTLLVNGGNAGWDPKDRASLSCPGGYCGYAGNASTMPMTDISRFPNAIRPSWTNNGASQGMGPAQFLDGAQWGAWNGRLAVGIMAAPRLVVLALDAAGIATDVVDVALPAVRMRALVQGPDGNLYVATGTGEIWRVVPSATP
jgi:aldose sugar dehydrogenase